MAELTGDLPPNPPTDLPGTEALPAHPASARAVRMWQVIFVSILVLFVGILAFRLWDTNTTEQRADGTAPDFTFTTFEGETISLADLRGKGVVVNFWAS